MKSISILFLFISLCFFTSCDKSDEDLYLEKSSIKKLELKSNSSESSLKNSSNNSGYSFFSVATVIQNRISEQYGIDLETVLLESSLSGDLGLEDLDLADLFIFCEDEFSIVFEDEDLEKIVTVNDLVNFCFQNILDTVDVNPPYNPGGSLGGGGFPGGGTDSGPGELPGSGGHSDPGVDAQTSILDFNPTESITYFEDDNYIDNGTSRPLPFYFWLEVVKNRHQVTGEVVGIVSVTAIAKKPVDEYMNKYGELVVRTITVLPSTMNYTTIFLGTSWLISARFTVNAVYKYYEGSICTKVITRQYQRTGSCVVW